MHKSKTYIKSSLDYSATLHGRWGTTDDFTPTVPPQPGLTESIPVVAWRGPDSNSQPYGDFLHLNRAALTSRPRRLSPLLLFSPALIMLAQSIPIHFLYLMILNKLRLVRLRIRRQLKVAVTMSFCKPHARVCLLHLSKHCLQSVVTSPKWPWRPVIDRIIVNPCYDRSGLKESWDLSLAKFRLTEPIRLQAVYAQHSPIP